LAATPPSEARLSAIASALPASMASMASAGPARAVWVASGEARLEARKVAVSRTPTMRTPARLASWIVWMDEPGATR
jgi:hypothetical protein